MSELKLAVRNDQREFRPGDAITGAAGWKLDQTPRSVELRLFWRTEGKGTEDAGIAETKVFESPQAEEARPFSFTAPPAPYSFSGQLISLLWSLELVVEPGGVASRVDLVIGPTGREVLLGPAGKKS